MRAASEFTALLYLDLFMSLPTARATVVLGLA